MQRRRRRARGVRRDAGITAGFCCDGDISTSARWPNSNPLSGLMRMPSWRTFPDTPTSNRPFRSAKSRSEFPTYSRTKNTVNYSSFPRKRLSGNPDSDPQVSHSVVPAQAGTQGFQSLALGPRFRGGDDWRMLPIWITASESGNPGRKRSSRCPRTAFAGVTVMIVAAPAPADRGSSRSRSPDGFGW